MESRKGPKSPGKLEKPQEILGKLENKIGWKLENTTFVSQKTGNIGKNPQKIAELQKVAESQKS